MYFNQELYKVILFSTEVQLIYLLVPIILYLLLMNINTSKIGLLLGSILKVLNLILALALGGLGFKIFKAENLYLDYVIDRKFFSIQRIWNESDYLNFSKDFFKNKNIENVNIEELLKTIQPDTMLIWKEFLNDYIGKFVKLKDTLKDAEIATLKMEVLSSSYLQYFFSPKTWIVVSIIGVLFTVSLYYYYGHSVNLKLRSIDKSIKKLDENGLANSASFTLLDKKIDNLARRLDYVDTEIVKFIIKKLAENHSEVIVLSTLIKFLLSNLPEGVLLQSVHSHVDKEKIHELVEALYIIIHKYTSREIRNGNIVVVDESAQQISNEANDQSL
jgi:hypothetical protein